jgi:two-component system phosphate regulon response regulator PhoB
MKTILIAEDEESSIALFEAMVVGHSDWDLIIARSGQEAQAAVANRHLDVALLDIQLPAPDGLELCRCIKSGIGTASTFVIMVSAMTQEASRTDAREAGADDFVAKPFSTTELTQRLESILA